MKYCPTCGVQLSDNAVFCESCGTRLSGVKETAKPVRSVRGFEKETLQCPECGSNSLLPVVESTNAGGVAVSSRVTGRVGVTTYNTTTTHRNYWMCQSCGNKFRNLQNLNEELARETQLLKTVKVFGFLFTAISLLLALMMAGNKHAALLYGFGLLLGVSGAIAFGILWMIKRKYIAKLDEEKQYLETHCFGRFEQKV